MHVSRQESARDVSRPAWLYQRKLWILRPLFVTHARDETASCKFFFFCVSFVAPLLCKKRARLTAGLALHAVSVLLSILWLLLSLLLSACWIIFFVKIRHFFIFFFDRLGIFLLVVSSFNFFFRAVSFLRSTPLYYKPQPYGMAPSESHDRNTTSG